MTSSGGYPASHSTRVISGVGHDHTNMFQSAEGLSALFDSGRNSSFASSRRLKTTDEEAAAARLAGKQLCAVAGDAPAGGSFVALPL